LRTVTLAPSIRSTVVLVLILPSSRDVSIELRSRAGLHPAVVAPGSFLLLVRNAERLLTGSTAYLLAPMLVGNAQRSATMRTGDRL
jgi:hypothetical protein